jgi:hypothetical protein
MDIKADAGFGRSGVKPVKYSLLYRVIADR